MVNTHKLTVQARTYPTRGEFRLSRGAVSQVDVVVVKLSDGMHVGRGECRPYARYGESVKSVMDQIESRRPDFETAPTRIDMGGAAANAVNSAFLDLMAKRTARPAWHILGVPQPKPRRTAFTLSVDNPANMAKAARAADAYPCLKLKVDMRAIDQVKAVATARPDASFIVDANEAFDPDQLATFLAALSDVNIAMVEQPLPHGSHLALPASPNHVICADESFHSADDLPALWNAGYRAVCVKLDKAGGPWRAHDDMRSARAAGFQVMAGCMVGSSLAMAPMVTLESLADTIDLDGPLLLDEDVDHGLIYEGAIVKPPSRELWG